MVERSRRMPAGPGSILVVEDDRKTLFIYEKYLVLAGFHVLNASMFDLARGYAEEQMPAYVRLQQHEFELEEFGYTATRHQHEVGAGYFDLVTQAIAPDSETLALRGSTEEAQFTKEPA